MLLFCEDLRASPEKMARQGARVNQEKMAPQGEMAETAGMDLKEAEVTDRFFVILKLGKNVAVAALN